MKGRVQVLVREAIKSITTADWVGYCQLIVKLEMKYWFKGGVLENAVNSLVIRLCVNENGNDKVLMKK